MCCSVRKLFHCSRNRTQQSLTTETKRKAKMKKLTVCLLGKQGAGKSASGNTLLGHRSFYTTASPQRVTQACSMSFTFVDELKIKVIDTPGWCISSQFETEIKPKMIEFINECKPHVFLLVLPIGRFISEETDTVLNIFKEFGDEVNKYMIVLFTKGDDLEEKPIKDYMKELHQNLRSVIRICGERYHVFNNRNKQDQQQVSSLVKKLKEMVETNEGNHYTEAAYKKAKQPRNEVENSVPEKIPATEKEKKCDYQVVSADEKEEAKEETKEETLDDRNEVKNSVPEKIPATEKEKKCDYQVVSADGKEEAKEETLDDRKNVEVLQKLDLLTETTENERKFGKDINCPCIYAIQRLGKELAEMQEKFNKQTINCIICCARKNKTMNN